MRPDQKANIPPEVLAKVFLKDGKISTKQFNFLMMLYMLNQGNGKKVVVAVLDDEHGMGVEQFYKFKKGIKKNKIPDGMVDACIASGDMVFSDSELMGWLSLINGACMSPAYKYALSIKNTSAPKVTNKAKEFSYICGMLMNYEGNKKRITRQENISIPELYILYYLSDGNEKRGVPLFTEVYKNAVNASRKQIFEGLKRLRETGLITMSGGKKNALYKITATGKERIYKMVSKYVIA